MSATAYAWTRYRRLMRWMMAITVALVAVALRLVWRHAARASIESYVVAALAVGSAMLIGSAVMGLFVLSRRRVSDAPADTAETPPPAPRRSDAPE